MLDQLLSSQQGKEITANENFDAVSVASLFGRHATATSALTWGYYGGTINVSGTISVVADGAVTLTASTTNYVEATTAGVVSVNQTAFTSGRIPIRKIVTGTATVTSEIDSRAIQYAVQP